MKYLTLLRHAKSSWKDPGCDDFDRSLNKRGRQDAPLIGGRLAMLGEVPEVIISSPARRARNTADLVAAALPCQPLAIRYEPRIYEAVLGTLIEIVNQLDDDWQNVMLVGHNPGLTDLVNAFAPCKIDNIVTCGLVKLAFRVDSWRDIQFNGGRLLFYEYPGAEE
ncbi:MAG: histidine phosphatase family protein [Desulfuromonadales bacterium]|nr:histidine phosphatase family protein [Desulfuromonadales bacterium]